MRRYLLDRSAALREVYGNEGIACENPTPVLVRRQAVANKDDARREHAGHMPPQRVNIGGPYGRAEKKRRGYEEGEQKECKENEWKMGNGGPKPRRARSKIAHGPLAAPRFTSAGMRSIADAFKYRKATSQGEQSGGKTGRSMESPLNVRASSVSAPSWVTI